MCACVCACVCVCMGVVCDAMHVRWGAGCSLGGINEHTHAVTMRALAALPLVVWYIRGVFEIKVRNCTWKCYGNHMGYHTDRSVHNFVSKGSNTALSLISAWTALTLPSMTA